MTKENHKRKIRKTKKGGREMNMPPLLPPKMDFVFKGIFGNEKHPNILVSFLNAVLTPEDPIVSVELKETDINKEYIDDKFSRLDIKAITDKNEHVNVEIQLKNEDQNMLKRSLYYWSRMYSGQLGENGKYKNLARTVCINLIDFNYLDTEHYHTKARLRDCVTNEELTDLIEIHFIELKKMKDINHVEELKSQLEAWLCFIKNPMSEVVYELEQKEEAFREAKNELIRVSQDKKTRVLYEKYLEARLEERSQIEAAEERGEKTGIEKGKQQEKIENAINLLDVLDDETISLKLNLSVEVVRKLRLEND